MKITGSMLNEALETSHDECHGDCIHTDAMADIGERFATEIFETMLLSMLHGDKAASYLYVAALHVGYRLRQVVERHEKEVTELQKML